MRLVLDEHLDNAIAVELRRRGHDVVAVTEDPHLHGIGDRELLAWAAEVGRVIVTYDARGFGPLVEERQVLGEPLTGVIFLSSKRYPQGQRSYGALMRDLARVLEQDPAADALSGSARWLGD